MSIVVAVKKQDQVFVAADSQTSFGDHRITEGNGKLVEASGNVIGLAGWGIYSNLLRIHLKKNPLKTAENEIDVFEFFVDFWKVIRSEYTLVSDKSEGDGSPFAELDSTFIVATPESIFYVADDMSVVRFGNFYAIGSGAPFALGALRIMYDNGFTVEEMATKAVEAAISFDSGCGGEVKVKRL